MSHNFFFFHKSPQCITAQTLIPSYNHFVSGDGKNVSSSSFQIHCQSKQRKKLRLRHSSHGVKASLFTSSQKPVSVKAVITVIEKVGAALTHLGLSRGLDEIADLLGRTILVELVAADLDSSKYNSR